MLSMLPGLIGTTVCMFVDFLSAAAALTRVLDGACSAVARTFDITLDPLSSVFSINLDVQAVGSVSNLVVDWATARRELRELFEAELAVNQN